MNFKNKYKSLVFRIAILAVFWLTTISTVGTLTSCKKEETPVPADTTKSMAQNFTLKSLAGDTVKLSDYNNKVVVLFFFGYNCSYCKTSAPAIQENLVTPYAARTDYMVLGLDTWNGPIAGVENFMSSTGITFPLLLNASGVGGDYGTTYDRLMVIDKMGYLRFKGNQAAIKDVDTARQIINGLLSQ